MEEVLKKIVKVLCKSSKKEKRFLYLSYLLNVFLISVVLMIASVVSDTSGLSETDVDQSYMMVGVISVVAIMIIIFFLWLISMEFIALYNSRDIFNHNVRMMGFPGGKLILVYLIEMLTMQPACIIGGCILGEIVYHVYATVNGESILWIKLEIVIISVLIHVFVLLLTVLAIGLKCVRHSVVLSMRGEIKYNEQKKWKILIRIIISLALIGAIYFIGNRLHVALNYENALKYCQIIKLIYIVIIIVAFEPIMKLLFNIADIVGKKLGTFHFIVSLKMTESYWGRFKAMAYLIIFSGSLICGLYTLYENCRTYVTNMAAENIHYYGYGIYNEKFTLGEEVADESYYTFRYQAYMENGEKIWITGVDEEYLNVYETLVSSEMSKDGDLVDLADDRELIQLLGNEDFNGIILPFNDTSEVGDTITLFIDGHEIEFRVYAKSLSINGDRRDAYVSRTYLKKQLADARSYNTVYYMKEPESGEMKNALFSQTKEDMLEEVYQYIVKGTETIETIFWMIVICSLFAVCTCMVMSGHDNQTALAHLQGLGASKVTLKKIYVYQVLWNVMCTVFPMVFLTYLISKSLAYMTLHPGYFQTGFRADPWRIILLFSIYLGISILLQLILIRKSTKDGIYIKILRS